MVVTEKRGSLLLKSSVSGVNSNKGNGKEPFDEIKFLSLSELLQERDN